jgi:hypothetical protein
VVRGGETVRAAVRAYFVRSAAVTTVQTRLVIAAEGISVESTKEIIKVSTPDQLGRSQQVPRAAPPDVLR